MATECLQSSKNLANEITGCSTCLNWMVAPYNLIHRFQRHASSHSVQKKNLRTRYMYLSVGFKFQCWAQPEVSSYDFKVRTNLYSMKILLSSFHLWGAVYITQQAAIYRLIYRLPRKLHEQVKSWTLGLPQSVESDINLTQGRCEIKFWCLALQRRFSCRILIGSLVCDCHFC